MRDFKAKAIIRNAPDYPLEKYVVCKAVFGELWFWGTWDDKHQAYTVANQFENGCVVEVDECDI